MRRLLSTLLAEEPLPLEGDTSETWWQNARRPLARFRTPVERAIVGGFYSDRLGYALVAGYRAALQVLVPALPEEELVSFCVTEAEGNHPRAIRTALERQPDGTALLSGKKRYSTLGPVASALVVIASEGTDDEGRNRLRAVWLDSSAPGLVVRAMPGLPFVPEVPHAELQLERVRAEAGRVLAGDGYLDFAKPFRTLEDLFVQAAVAGYLIGAGRRGSAPPALIERAVALVLSARALSDLDPRRSEAHLALAGLLGQVDDLIGGEEGMSRLGLRPEERARFERDRAIFSVAGAAREKRREQAWKTLTGGLKRTL